MASLSIFHDQIERRIQLWREYAQDNGGQFERTGSSARVDVEVDNVWVRIDTVIGDPDTRYRARALSAAVPDMRLSRQTLWGDLAGRIGDMFGGRFNTRMLRDREHSVRYLLSSRDVDAALDLLEDLDLAVLAEARTPTVYLSGGWVVLQRPGAVIVKPALHRGVRAAAMLARLGVAAMVAIHEELEQSEWVGGGGSFLKPQLPRIHVSRGEKVLELCFGRRAGRRVLLALGPARKDLRPFSIRVDDGVPLESVAGLSHDALAQLAQASPRAVVHDEFRFELQLSPRATPTQARAALDVIAAFHRPPSTVFR